MCDGEINTRKYGSLPVKTSGIVKKLRDEFGDELLLHVPGFVEKTNSSTDETFIAIASGPGMLIPCRNILGMVVAVKVRLDKPDKSGKFRLLSSAKTGNGKRGPGAINAVHLPYARRSNRPIGTTEIVRITEGELKADVAAALDESMPTISVPGVGNWRPALPVLEKLGTRVVHLAFDGDAIKNPEVARHLIDCHAGLVAAGLEVRIEHWPLDQGKGIDDLLAAGLKPEVLTSDAAAEFLEKLRAVKDSGKAGDAAKQSAGHPAAVKTNEETDDPYRLARILIQTEFTNSRGERTIVFYRDEFYEHDGICYRTIPDADIRARMSNFIKSEFDAENTIAIEIHLASNKKGELPKCRKVTIPMTNNALAALKGLILLPSHLQAPLWLSDSNGIDPTDIFATKSGLLVLSKAGEFDDCLLPSTANFFSTSGVDFSYDPNALCPTWISFLDQLWPCDHESAETLSQWIGYLLTSDIRHHKLAMLVGPSRSGKGTIGRVIKGLIGERNFATPKLSSLAGQFGLQPLLSKTAAMISDARLSNRVDGIAIVENILSISGADPQDVHRKNMTTLTGIRLPVRFTILTNELPNLRDASGALTNRVILLRMTRSFLGCEDKTLDDRLAAELPGILNWAIFGLRSLRGMGGFVQPASGQELLADLEDLASPIKQFIRERCHVGPEWETTIEDAFISWQEWCKQHGRDHTGTRETFGRDIRAALPQVESKQIRANGTRIRVYVGFSIKNDF